MNQSSSLAPMCWTAPAWRVPQVLRAPSLGTRTCCSRRSSCSTTTRWSPALPTWPLTAAPPALVAPLPPACNPDPPPPPPDPADLAPSSPRFGVLRRRILCRWRPRCWWRHRSRSSGPRERENGSRWRILLHGRRRGDGKRAAGTPRGMLQLVLRQEAGVRSHVPPRQGGGEMAAVQSSTATSSTTRSCAKAFANSLSPATTSPSTHPTRSPFEKPSFVPVGNSHLYRVSNPYKRSGTPWEIKPRYKCRMPPMLVYSPLFLFLFLFFLFFSHLISWSFFFSNNIPW
jgi:hypothetical protein